MTAVEILERLLEDLTGVPYGPDTRSVCEDFPACLRSESSKDWCYPCHLTVMVREAAERAEAELQRARLSGEIPQ